MPVQPLALQTVVDRVAAQCLSDALYHLVERAANAQAAIEARTHAMPAAFILEPSYTAIGTPNASGGLITQEMDWEIGVLTVVRNYAGNGGLQSQDAETLRGALWGALIGWAPEESYRTIDAGRGSLLDFDDAVFYYLDVFTLRRRIRNVA